MPPLYIPQHTSRTKCYSCPYDTSAKTNALLFYSFSSRYQKNLVILSCCCIKTVEWFNDRGGGGTETDAMSTDFGGCGASIPWGWILYPVSFFCVHHYARIFIKQEWFCYKPRRGCCCHIYHRNMSGIFNVWHGTSGNKYRYLVRCTTCSTL